MYGDIAPPISDTTRQYDYRRWQLKPGSRTKKAHLYIDPCDPLDLANYEQRKPNRRRRNYDRVFKMQLVRMPAFLRQSRDRTEKQQAGLTV